MKSTHDEKFLESVKPYCTKVEDLQNYRIECFTSL